MIPRPNSKQLRADKPRSRDSPLNSKGEPMYICVRNNALQPPVFVSNEATWTEVRDESGSLVLILLFLPGKATCMVVDREDSNFAEVVKGFGVKLEQDPRDLLDKQPSR